MPRPELITLENGIKIYNLGGADFDGNRLTLNWPVGSAEVHKPAALNIMTAALNQGAAGISGAEIADTLEFNGVLYSSAAASHTISLNLFSLNRSFANLLPLVRDMILRPDFPEDAVAVMRQRAATSRSLECSRVADIALQQNKVKILGSSHPLTRYETPEEINALTRDDIIDAFRQSIGSTLPSIYLAGNTEQILPLLIDTMAAIDPLPGVDNVIHPMQPTPGRYHTPHPGASQQAVRISIPTIGRDHPDYIGLRFAIIALGGYFGSRLMSNIREDKGYTYGISAQLWGLREGAFLTVNCESDPRYVSGVIDETFREIERMATEPMSMEELETVRSTELNTLASMLDTPFSVMDQILATHNNAIPDGYFERQITTLSAITPEEIMRLISTHIDPARAIINTAG